MLGRLRRAGYELVADAARPDVIVVNTCAFIDRAKQESIDTILEMAREKETGRARRLVVTGCLAQRYDAGAAPGDPRDRRHPRHGPGRRHPARGRRAKRRSPTPRRACRPGSTTTPRRACSRPAGLHGLREDQRRLRLHLLLLHHPHAARPAPQPRRRRTSWREVRALAARGVKEIVLVAQDSTRYGLDLGLRDGLAYLLRRLGRVDGIRWIRVMYAYPATLSDAHPGRDRRRGEGREVRGHPAAARERRGARAHEAAHRPRQPAAGWSSASAQRVPGVAFRTSFIVGFPGETEAEFEELLAFVRGGASSTTSASSPSPTRRARPRSTCPGRVPAAVKERRRRRLMAAQKKISARRNRRRVGERVEVLVEGDAPGHRPAAARPAGHPGARDRRVGDHQRRRPPRPEPS